MVEHSLVLFDADKIKQYVFATGRLKEIRGASEQVRQLTDPEAIKALFQQWVGRPLEDWQEGCTDGLIYAGGGAGALLVATSADAQTFCTELERTYRRTTGSAMLSAVWVPVEAEQEAEAQTRAARMLAHRKGSRCTAEDIPGGGFIRFCDSDRRYPASDQSFDGGRRRGDKRMLSASSANKHRKNELARDTSSFWPIFLEQLRSKGRTASEIAQWEESRAHRKRQDMDAIGSQSKPQNYVAFVFADGDGVGSMLQTVVKTYGFRGYHQVSRVLSEAAERATAAALASAYQHHALQEHRDEDTEQSYRAIPFDVITIGGDDVMLLCTAEQALAIACHLSQEFRQQAAALLESYELTLTKPLTLSVGVVIAHTAHPIVNLAQRAGELLKSAKQERVQSDQHNEGWIDFHIVSTPGLESVGTIRKEHYTQLHNLMLTARPYPLSDMQHLLDHAGRLRHTLPGSKRSQLYQACLAAHNRVSATLAVLQTQVRMSERQRTALLEALSKLGVRICYPFVQDTKGEYRTPLPDLMEVAEFVAIEQEAHK